MFSDFCDWRSLRMSCPGSKCYVVFGVSLRSFLVHATIKHYTEGCHWNFGPEIFGPGPKFSLKILVRSD